jgi:cysteinyl-tRNA synthetase
VKDKKETITATDLVILKKTMNDFVFDIFGLKEEESGGNNALVDELMKTIITLRQKARENKDYATSDLIRDHLAKINIKVKDTKDGAEWSLEG